MSKLIDLTGQRFGHLLVLERDKTATKNAKWICQCDCGKICIKASQSLRSGQAICCHRDKCQYARKRYIDLTGQRFGRLTVLNITDKMQGPNHIWHCRCDCGNECDVSGPLLRYGGKKSCGCLKQETDRGPKPHLIDLTGQKFGHLTVIERIGSDSRSEPIWKCRCDCEAQTEILVLSGNLRKGHTQSCGCDRRSHGEKVIAKLLQDNDINFSQEYRAFKFESGNWARFDFYVNNQYLIEYDGETHFNYNLHGWHTKDQLLLQQQRDEIKNNFCFKNNIPLIRIPYTHLKELCIEDLKLETTKYLVKENKNG